MHRDSARQARGAKLELAGKGHTHWKRVAPLMKRHIPGMHDREPDNGRTFSIAERVCLYDEKVWQNQTASGHLNIFPKLK